GAKKSAVSEAPATFMNVRSSREKGPHMPTNPYDPADPRAELLDTVLDTLAEQQPGSTATGYAAATIDRLREEYPDASPTGPTPDVIASRVMVQYESDERLSARMNPTSFVLRRGLLIDMLAEAARRGRGEA
ncbi:MAG: hypothetical protein QM598_05595, partial [Protaetiibacter sp.]